MIYIFIVYSNTGKYYEVLFFYSNTGKYYEVYPNINLSI